MVVWLEIIGLGKFICHKNQVPLIKRIVPGTLIILMCCYLSTGLSQAVFVSPINTPSMMGDGMSAKLYDVIVW